MNNIIEGSAYRVQGNSGVQPASQVEPLNFQLVPRNPITEKFTEEFFSSFIPMSLCLSGYSIQLPVPKRKRAADFLQSRSFDEPNEFVFGYSFSLSLL